MNRRTSRTPRTFIGLVAALGLLVALTMPALATDKVGICHRTQAGENNPYVYIEVADDAAEEDDNLSDHLANNDTGHPAKYWTEDGVWRGVPHEEGDPRDDYLATSAAECEDLVVATPTPTPTPTESSSGSTATPTPSPTPTPSESVAVETSTPTPTPSASERGGVEGGNPTPAPSGGELPDTAMAAVTSVPATLLGLVALLSISALLYVRLAGVPARR